MCPLLIGLKIKEYKFYVSEILILFFWNIPIYMFLVDLSKTKEMCILYLKKNLSFIAMLG